MRASVVGRWLARVTLGAMVLVPACSPASSDDAAASALPADACSAGEDSCGSFACNLPPTDENASTDAGAADAADASSQPSDAKAPLFVSLTFDDTFADQYVLLEMLGAVGMHATMYVNSARIGEPSYLTAAQVSDFARAGHEIAGHTVTHPTLPTVDADEQKRQICNDRVALLARGFTVKNFAYPHGAFTPETQAIVKTCGYNSARVVGGLGCDGCPGGEPAAPLSLGTGMDVLAVRSPTSVKCNMTLTDLQRQVLTAESRGGGWLPMVFHHVCDGCGQNAVAPALLREFITWLAARKERGTVVRTVDEIVGGDFAPPVDGPPPAPARERTGNLLENPSFEEVDPTSDKLGRCWVKGGEGTNEFAFGRTPDAHTGAFAEWLEVTSMTDGARRIYTRQDLGYCAPVVQPGHVYRASAWYKSTVSPRFTVYYRKPSGFWAYWKTSPPLPPSDDWRQETIDLPAAPDDASAVSLSITLTTVGKVTMDDVSFTAVE